MCTTITWFWNCGHPRWRIIWITLRILALLFVLMWPRQAPVNRVVPDELVGAWVTSAPGYADRALEISKAAILFGTDGGETTVHGIWNIEQAPEGRRTLYTSYYTTEEGLEEKFAFYYEPANGGVIRLKNQEGVA